MSVIHSFNDGRHDTLQLTKFIRDIVTLMLEIDSLKWVMFAIL